MWTFDGLGGSKTATNHRAVVDLQMPHAGPKGGRTVELEVIANRKLYCFGNSYFVGAAQTHYSVGAMRCLVLEKKRLSQF